MLDMFGDSAAIGGWGGANGNYGGDVIINGGTINARAFGGAGIGSDGEDDESDAAYYNHPNVRDIFINGGNVTATAYLGEGIGAGYHGEVRSITIDPSAEVVMTQFIDTDGNNNNGNNNANDSNVSNVIKEERLYRTAIETTTTKYNPLVIHHGTKANQALHVNINDMHTAAMGINNDNMSVTTREKAQASLDVIDAAIDYALDEATNVGAYISRLEYTEANLTAASENTQASESTIRDADMAKAMTNYTKNNVLAQASQSMLAQANQNASSVLSLLQ